MKIKPDFDQNSLKTFENYVIKLYQTWLEWTFGFALSGLRYAAPPSIKNDHHYWK
jgi:hypothetical protein